MPTLEGMVRVHSLQIMFYILLALSLWATPPLDGELVGLSNCKSVLMSHILTLFYCHATPPTQYSAPYFTDLTLPVEFVLYVVTLIIELNRSLGMNKSILNRYCFFSFFLLSLLLYALKTSLKANARLYDCAKFWRYKEERSSPFSPGILSPLGALKEDKAGSTNAGDTGEPSGFEKTANSEA